MRISFACPSCSATCTVDDIHIGKRGRCKHCGAIFTIPNPESAEADNYALAEPAQRARPNHDVLSESVFLPPRSRSAAQPGPVRREWSDEPALVASKAHYSPSEVRWKTWLISAAIALGLIMAIATLVPGGTSFVGIVLVVLSLILGPVGGLGALYRVFSEEVLCGLLFLFLPFYDVYYIVTRWDDMWPWVTCVAASVGFLVMGVRLLG